MTTKDLVPQGSVVPFEEQKEEEHIAGVQPPKVKPETNVTETGFYEGEYTLQDRLVQYFRNVPVISNAADGSIARRNYADTNSQAELIMKEFGPYFLTLTPSRLSSQNQSIVFTANHAEILSQPFLVRILQSLYGELFDTLQNSDIADFLNLKDPSQSYNIGDERIASIRELSLFHELKDLKTYTPRDPYLLLMNTPVQARHFLSDCLDLEKDKLSSWFDKPDDFLTASNIKNTKVPLVSLSSILETAKKYQTRQIKQYVDAVQAVEKHLRSL